MNLQVGRALLLQTHSASLTYRQASLFKLRTHLINFAFGFTQILQYEDAEVIVPRGFQVSAVLSHHIIQKLFWAVTPGSAN